MRMLKKTYALELTQSEINNLEEDIFRLMSNYKEPIGSESIDKFKGDFTTIHDLFMLISQSRD